MFFSKEYIIGKKKNEHTIVKNQIYLPLHMIQTCEKRKWVRKGGRPNTPFTRGHQTKNLIIFFFFPSIRSSPPPTSQYSENLQKFGCSINLVINIIFVGLDYNYM